MSIVRRLLKVSELRVSDGANGKKTISGYAAVFDQRSELLYDWFEEIIRPGAFTKTLANADVRCLFNHNPDVVLGRTSAQTLRLREDTRGLYMECDLPDTTAAKDLAESIRRKDVSQQSFAFRVATQRWTYDKDPDKPALRELLEVELFDVSPVTYPAYPQTDVGIRSQDLGDEDLRAERQQYMDHVGAIDQDRLRMLRLAEAESAA